MIRLDAQRGRLHLHLTALRMGQDLCVTLTGGDREHLGAVALARPDAELCGLTVPGHREQELACEVAELLASRLQVTVCVACGIHLDQILKFEIEEALELSRELTRQLLASLALPE